MCNCADLPQAVAELEYWNRGFSFQGSTEHAAHFQELDGSSLLPPLNFTHFLYSCGECGQAWYIECLPEEAPVPGFALKLESSASSPSREEIVAAKEILCVLAHGGFESDKCRISGCTNRCLKGRALCQAHITFP